VPRSRRDYLSFLSFLSFFPRASTSGHAAFTAVRQMLSSIVLVPGVAPLRMSTPSACGNVTEICTGGFATTMFRLTTLPVVPATSTIPLVLPVTLLSSMTLSLLPAATMPMPKLLLVAFA
jgi:hypothetical protein